MQLYSVFHALSNGVFLLTLREIENFPQLICIENQDTACQNPVNSGPIRLIFELDRDIDEIKLW